MLDTLFANLANGFAAQFGAPFQAATARWQGDPVKDAGGSIVSPAAPISIPCRVQFDVATQAMRAAEGFLETDVRIIVLSAGLSRTLDSEAEIVVSSGQYGGTWAVLSCTRDPVGIGFECRARRVRGVVAAPPANLGQFDFSDPANSGLLALILEDA